VHAGELGYTEFVQNFRDRNQKPKTPPPEKPRQPTPPPPPPPEPSLRELRLARKTSERRMKLAEAETQRQFQQQAEGMRAAEAGRRAEAARLAALGDGMQERRKRTVDLARMGVNTRFADMYRAFKHIDLDNSGTVDRKELEHFLELMNVPMNDEQVAATRARTPTPTPTPTLTLALTLTLTQTRWPCR
jgi:hypothetical protein